MKDYYDCLRYCVFCYLWKSKDIKVCCFRDVCLLYYWFKVGYYVV